MKISTQKREQIRAALVLLGIAALMLFGGVIFFRDMQGDYRETTATISDMERRTAHASDGSSITYDVYVDYTVDGTTYTRVPLNSYSASMKIGKTLTICYDVDHPKKIHEKNTQFVPYLLFAVGGVLAVAGVFKIARAFQNPPENDSHASTVG